MRRVSFKPISFLFLFTLILPVLSFASDLPPADVSMAAEKGLAVFIKSDRLGARQRLGFLRQEDADVAVLGRSFRLFTIPPDRFTAVEDVADLQSLSVETGLWDFLILKHGEAQAVLTVDLMQGVWTPVSIGASGLAKELSRLVEIWPVSEGYEYRIVRIYQAKADLAEISKDGRILGVVPLGSYLSATGEEARNYSPERLRSAKEVVAALRHAVKKNLELEGGPWK